MCLCRRVHARPRTMQDKAESTKHEICDEADGDMHVARQKETLTFQGRKRYQRCKAEEDRKVSRQKET